MKAKMTMIIIGSIYATAGVYMVPKEYDNLYASINSQTKTIISNHSSAWSHRAYRIGGRDLHYRCEYVPKQDCRGAKPSIHLSLRDISLRDDVTNRIVPIYARDARAEDAGAYWRVCAAAVGGLSWDDTNIQYDKNGNKITYTYNHDKKGKFFYFFTNDANRGSDESYITVAATQSCTN